uniref:Uncharacterized protein n=1 Tax=viral metagenome TaxID=1070528 RepID=A0A6M3XZA4_9ZZZZ
MCSIKVIVTKKQFGDITFVGFRENNPRIEIPCNREDDHPKEGDHWFDGRLFKVTWTVDKDAIWLATICST